MERKSALAKPEEYFIRVIRAALECGNPHVTVLLRWLTSEYFLFPYGVGLYTNNDHKPSIKLFTDGYLSLKKSGRGLEIFGKRWAMITDNYEMRYTSENLRGGLLNNIRLLRRDPHLFFECKKKHYETSGKYAMKVQYAGRKSEDRAHLYRGRFLTTIDVPGTPNPKHCTPIWRTIPQRFRLMNISADTEIWMDGDDIIGGRGVGKLTPSNSPFFASFVESIFHMKYVVKRSRSREAIGDTMRAVGPLINYRSEGKGEHITFYKNKLKLSKRTPLNSEILELLYEQSSHRLLFEILLVLFAQNFWPALRSLLDIQFPFMKMDRVYEKFFSKDSSHFKNGIPSYPLFMTKNYCNMVHRDRDDSAFTLSLVSNPNSDPVGGYFTILDYGIKIPLLDGDIFFFRGSDRHGTSLRCDVINPVYVVASTINKKLGKHFKWVNNTL